MKREVQVVIKGDANIGHGMITPSVPMEGQVTKQQDKSGLIRNTHLLSEGTNGHTGVDLEGAELIPGLDLLASLVVFGHGPVPETDGAIQETAGEGGAHCT